MSRLSPESEADFLRTVMDLARAHGWLCFHDFDPRRNARGFPDLVLVRAGHVIFAELKSEAGRIRPEQTIWLDTLAACQGVEVYLWRPRDMPTIIAILTKPTCFRIVFASACLTFAS